MACAAVLSYRYVCKYNVINIGVVFLLCFWWWFFSFISRTEL